MNNVLDMKVGTKKTDAVIREIKRLTVLRKNNKLQPKLVFTVIDEITGLEYQVSDAWVKDKDETCVRALWFFETPNGIYANSTLAKAMKYYKAETLRDFIGATIQLFPDKNGYLTMVLLDDIGQ